ncbi:uncharacterized protein TrAtP1_013038 [Trichoderma atroviride]|uniref:uncharacterized protein n=1 Tax=Hypocrea atroviridis TaxID=63577 RepID=UPI0033316CD7|nr:hypothetical protein TrAtP1_013038 [Trichoderma atroviride]
MHLLSLRCHYSTSDAWLCKDRPLASHALRPLYSRPCGTLAACAHSAPHLQQQRGTKTPVGSLNRTLHPTWEKQTETAIMVLRARPVDTKNRSRCTPSSSKREATWGGESRFELQNPDCRLYGHRTAQSSYLKRTSTAFRSCILIWGSGRSRRWVAWPVSTLIEHRKPALHQGGLPVPDLFQAAALGICFQLPGLSGPAPAMRWNLLADRTWPLVYNFSGARNKAKLPSLKL